MISRVALFSYLLLGMLVSCGKPRPAVDQGRLALLAYRSCRAVSIRKERYVLADKIRFAQDTLADVENRVARGRLQKDLKAYLEQKNRLLKESLALADTIRLQLDSLMPYKDKEAQKRFTLTLDSLMAKVGCNKLSDQYN